MHDVLVELRDGTKLCGPLWEWRPAEGHFTLAGEDHSRVALKDVISAVNKDERTGPDGETVDIDLLERARQEGWDGTSNLCSGGGTGRHDCRGFNTFGGCREAWGFNSLPEYQEGKMKCMCGGDLEAVPSLTGRTSFKCSECEKREGLSAVVRNVFPVQPLPQGALPLYYLREPPVEETD